jgi:hypothetical protein
VSATVLERGIGGRRRNRRVSTRNPELSDSQLLHRRVCVEPRTSLLTKLSIFRLRKLRSSCTSAKGSGGGPLAVAASSSRERGLGVCERETGGAEEKRPRGTPAHATGGSSACAEGARHACASVERLGGLGPLFGWHGSAAAVSYRTAAAAARCRCVLPRPPEETRATHPTRLPSVSAEVVKVGTCSGQSHTRGSVWWS